MNILAIDPSINNVGIALYSTEEKKLQTRLYHPPNGSLLRKADSIHLQLHLLTFGCFPDVIIIEYPQWQASTKGITAAKQGYTLDLAFLVGYILSKWTGKGCIHFMPTPTEWKGQTPKKATEERVKKMFGDLKISEHEFDACGMIIWYLEEKI
jgi:hypothetical protein